MTLVVVAAFVVVVGGQQPQAPRPNVPSGVLLEPLGSTGEAVYPAFEGWGPLKDGTNVLLVGYFNRNKEAIDIPIGPDNRIEPGGPDYGQPTHFMPHRQLGMFTITVPKDFGQSRLTWTITVNGRTNSIPLKLVPDYVLQPFADIAVGNTPPIIRFSPTGPTAQGPIAALSKATTMTAKVGVPLAITTYAVDDGKYTSGSNAQPRNLPPPVELEWSKYRGPADVKFDARIPKLTIETGGPIGQPFKGSATTNVTFAAPGEYALHLNVDDFSGRGSGETGCCWTTAIVKVSVSQ